MPLVIKENKLKYIKFIVFLYIVFITHTVSASNYIVNASSLNIRSCAGTHCQIIGKLTKGNIIDAIQEHGEWIEIKTESGMGYVTKKFLKEENPPIRKTVNIIIYATIIITAIYIFLLIYMLPSKLASNNKNARKVYVVNLFFGWIPVIWLILLLAALVGESDES